MGKENGNKEEDNKIIKILCHGKRDGKGIVAK